MRRAAGVLLAAVAAALTTAAPVAAAERTVTYTVRGEGHQAEDLDRFREVAESVLADPRGWSLGGTLAYERVGSGGDLELVLASPQVVEAAAPVCSREWSCRVGRRVYINDVRWRNGTASWTHGLTDYQRYVILHEVGHWLGLDHYDCRAGGRLAPVMQQQSISLQGCLANVWPLVEERENVGRIQGVGVDWSPVEEKYRALGQAGGLLGGPVTWEQPTGTGSGLHQHFQGGVIYWTSGTGAHEVHGEINRRWDEIDRVAGPVGFPVTDELSTPDGIGRYNHFDGSGGASIYWTPETGAHEVYGAIRDRWEELRWEVGPVGYPVTGERPTPGGRGRYNHFRGSGGASIYWTPETGAHEVYGAIRDRWESLGWEQSRVGYPVSGEYDVAGGRRSDFEGGHIRWDRATGQTEVTYT